MPEDRLGLTHPARQICKLAQALFTPGLYNLRPVRYRDFM
jgi:hypothetical protein